MKITLYLMTRKGYEVLRCLLNNNFKNLISEIIVGRDDNIDTDFANEIIALCEDNTISYYERNEDYKVVSNYSIAISWRWLIPENKSKLIVLHDSLLPKYRGFSPLVNMLINKESKIGVSAIFASQEYDKGAIIDQSATEINYPITISEAIELISQDYTKIILRIFDTLNNGQQLKAVEQNEALASYSLWRDENDYFIDWEKDSNDILNFINSVSSPYKGAAAYINSFQKIRILEAKIEDDLRIENRDVGKVIFIKNKFPVIVCGTGLIKLTKIIDDETHESLIPLKNFRVRLTSFNTIIKKRSENNR